MAIYLHIAPLIFFWFVLFTVFYHHFEWCDGCKLPECGWQAGFQATSVSSLHLTFQNGMYCYHTYAGFSTNMNAAGKNIFPAGKPSSRVHI